MDFEKIRILAKLMEDKDLAEIEIERDEFKVRLKKAQRDFSSAKLSKINDQMVDSQHGVNLDTKEDKSSLIDIVSSAVGTFYPYLRQGDEVKAGQVIAGIESMKVINDVVSNVEGKVINIAVEQGHPVEFGQVLFRIQPKNKKDGKFQQDLDAVINL